MRIVSRHVGHAEGENPQLLLLLRAGDGDSLQRRQRQRQHGHDQEAFWPRRAERMRRWLILQRASAGFSYPLVAIETDGGVRRSALVRGDKKGDHVVVFV